MSLYAFDFRDQLYAPWEQARGPLIEQLDLLYAGLNAAVVQKDPTTGLVTGIGGDMLNNAPTAAVQVNLTTNAIGVLPIANGGTGATTTLQLPIALQSNTGLVGNGTQGNPLGLQVDGSTITVNGSNQIVASATVSFAVTAVGTIHSSFPGDIFALNDTFRTNVIAGIAGKVIVPLWVYMTSSQTGSASGAYSTSAQVKLCYTGLTTALVTPSNSIVSTVDFTQTNLAIHSTNLFDTSSTTTFQGLGIDIRAAGGAFCSSDPTKVPAIGNAMWIAYVVMG